MDVFTLAAMTDNLQAIWTYLAEPIRQTPWLDWRDFWMGQVFADRFVVVYCLPFLPVLLLLSRQKLRLGIIMTGLAFVGYVCGALYAGLWLATCVVFHGLGERFAARCERGDGGRISPALAMGVVVTIWYVITMALHNVQLPEELNTWLFDHVPWIFPLGVRGTSWEPFLRMVHHAPGNGGPPRLVHAMFWNVHNIGTAYLSVRLLHYFSDIKRGKLPAGERSLLNFMAYVCYAPALLQGPIDRFQTFQEQMDTCHGRRRARDVAAGLWRIGWGLCKSVIVVLYFLPLLGDHLGLGPHGIYYEDPRRIESFWLLYTGVFWQIFTLYLLFSGYCDVAIGVSRLLGYRLLENFNWPWLATSMRDFWRRWHISLSGILRDYVYIPLGGNRRHVWWNLCLTFFLIGIWHALIPQLGIWGIVMGLMVWVNGLWARWMKRLDEAPAGALPALRRGCLKLRPLPTILAWLVTQHAFVFSLLIFFGGSKSIGVLGEILRRIWQ